MHLFGYKPAFGGPVHSCHPHRTDSCTTPSILVSPTDTSSVKDQKSHASKTSSTIRAGFTDPPEQRPPQPMATWTEEPTDNCNSLIAGPPPPPVPILCHPTFKPRSLVTFTSIKTVVATTIIQSAPAPSAPAPSAPAPAPPPVPATSAPYSVQSSAITTHAGGSSSTSTKPKPTITMTGTITNWDDLPTPSEPVATVSHTTTIMSGSSSSTHKSSSSSSTTHKPSSSTTTQKSTSSTHTSTGTAKSSATSTSTATKAGTGMHAGVKVAAIFGSIAGAIALFFAIWFIAIWLVRKKRESDKLVMEETDRRRSAREEALREKIRQGRERLEKDYATAEAKTGFI